MDEFKPYHIQQAVVASLKEEFEKAVDKARVKALAEAEKALMEGQPPYNSGYRAGFDLLSARRAILSLQQSAEGRYSLCYRFGTVSSVSNGYQLWGQYLQSIGRLDTMLSAACRVTKRPYANWSARTAPRRWKPASAPSPASRSMKH